MAFGSWFKNIVKGAGNMINKFAPKIMKAAETVGKISPLISQAGGLLGGNVGNVINKVGNVAGKINGEVNNRFKGSTLLGRVSPLNHLNDEANNKGVRRFDIPLLKE